MTTWLNKHTSFIVHCAWCICTLLLLPSCRESWRDLTAEQADLIGRAVNFNTSIAEEFTTRAYTSDPNGSFNENDRMRIYRNYYDTENNRWSDEVAYRTYYRKTNRIVESIQLGTDWDVEVGRKGFGGAGKGNTEFTQTAADTLTWENGKTLRFRAWSRSNYHDALRVAKPTHYYPDYCLADWVNASGPTLGIPLVLRHLGCRIWVSARQTGNEFHRIEIADALEDYKRADNAGTTDRDGSSTEAGKTDAQAQLELDSVMAVYRRMCLPAGVDMHTGYLKSVLSSSWETYTDKQVQTLEEQPDADFYTYGSSDATTIATSVMRPFFSLINSNMHMITIPYDMSNGITQGEVLTLPACTRFRVFIRDINNGDGAYDGHTEGEHILCLSDIYATGTDGKILRDADGKPKKAFPNGMELRAGYSYHIFVGYRYGELTATLNPELSWTAQDAVVEDAEDAVVAYDTDTTDRYTWWKQTIHNAIPVGAQDFNPVFHITNEREFLAFMELVNGTAPKRTSGLYRLVRSTDPTTGAVTSYGWSTRNSQYNPVWVTEEEMEREGYIFYDHYHAANADRPAYSERDYLRGPYPFYNEDLGRCFSVMLDCDLDLLDWRIPGIALADTCPFSGRFDGQGHTIRNLYPAGECLFGYVIGAGAGGASVTNLKIESTHPVCLLNHGEKSIYIAGVCIDAPSTTNSIAREINPTYSTTVAASYVVGCLHVGDAGGALVGTASNLNMYGCMQAAAGLGSGGALLGAYPSGSPAYFAPQITLSSKSTAKPSFRRFMCNFYDTDLSPSAHAVGTITDDYSLLEYIRGRRTDILCAKNDHLAGDDYSMKQILSLTDEQIVNLYGLAPWHAMDYAIYWYNQNVAKTYHRCTVHYELSAIGYHHHYPDYLSGSPEDTYTPAVVATWNPIDQTN